MNDNIVFWSIFLLIMLWGFLRLAFIYIEHVCEIRRINKAHSMLMDEYRLERQRLLDNAEASGRRDKAAFAAPDGCPNPTQEKV